MDFSGRRSTLAMPNKLWHKAFTQNRLIGPIIRAPVIGASVTGASVEWGPQMRQRPLQIAILGGTTALVILLSLLATTPLLFRHLVTMPVEQPAPAAAGEPLDLQNISTFRLLATSARILVPTKAPVVTVNGIDGGTALSCAISAPAARAWNCA